MEQYATIVLRGMIPNLFISYVTQHVVVNTLFNSNPQSLKRLFDNVKLPVIIDVVDFNQESKNAFTFKPY